MSKFTEVAKSLAQYTGGAILMIAGVVLAATGLTTAYNGMDNAVNLLSNKKQPEQSKK